jgi:hypothetical protein
MFMGESMCLAAFAVKTLLGKDEPSRASQFQKLLDPGTGEGFGGGSYSDAQADERLRLTEGEGPSVGVTPRGRPRAKGVSWTAGALCLIPAMCDVGATTLSGIGLLYTTSSTFLLLKGSVSGDVDGAVDRAVIGLWVECGRRRWGPGTRPFIFDIAGSPVLVVLQGGVSWCCPVS